MHSKIQDLRKLPDNNGPSSASRREPRVLDTRASHSQPITHHRNTHHINAQGLSIPFSPLHIPFASYPFADILYRKEQEHEDLLLL